MTIRGEGHSTDHRRAEATRAEKLADSAQLRSKVHPEILAYRQRVLRVLVVYVFFRVRFAGLDRPSCKQLEWPVTVAAAPASR